MPRTLFPMATGTHRLNNRFLVEEQEERGHSERHGDFQLAHCPKTCASVFLCASRHKHQKKKFSNTHVVHTHTLSYRYTNRCKIVGILLPVIPPQWLLSLAVYTPVSLISKLSERQKQGRKRCVMICVCTLVNTWLITIYYVLPVG